MSFIFMVFHYPRADARDELLAGMRGMADSMRAVPGCIEVTQWVDASGRVVGLSRWASRAAFDALGLEFGSPSEIPPGETRPRERFFLEEA